MFYLFLLNKTKTYNIVYAKFTALVLVCGMLFSGIPAIVFAEEGGDTTPQSTEESQPAEETNDQSDDGGDAQDDSADLTVIETGDAVADVDVVNTVNTNETDISASEEESAATTGEGTGDTFSDEDGDNSTTTDENLMTDGEADDTPDSQTSSTTSATTSPAVSASSTNAVADDVETDGDGDETFDIIVTNDNDAVVENTATTTAQTGENEASGNDGDALIITGDSSASADVVNTVNTNILNSEGFLLLLDSFSGELDLRDLVYWDLLAEGENEISNNDCDLGSCNTTDLFSSNDNTAEIVNDITVSASTGDNTASGNSNSAILTGDAYASANVVNIANTNIVDSNYLLISANNFGDLSGDIIFPTAAEFSRLFFGGVENVASNMTVTNDNTAVIENNVNVVANSGNNEANGNGGNSFIMTGDAYAGSNVVNQINQNITNMGSFFLLIRVHGDWAGSVYAAPEELAWTETPNGVALYNNTPVGGSVTGAGALTVQNSNTAAITNNVNVYALTGENYVNGNSENAGILTGDAYASANIVNVANTNVIGQNWMIAIVNIFGNWDGSISFGQPDLWVGGQIDTKGIGYLDVGDKVTYHYTVINNSDTTAPNVRVVDKMDEYITFNRSFTNGYVDDGNAVWDIGDLGPGESVEVEYEAFVNSKIPSRGSYPVENVVTVSHSISDANYNDNTDVVSFTAHRFVTSFFNNTDNNTDLALPELTPDPILYISKTNSATTTLFASTTVDYTITVRNDGGEAYNAILFDALKDGSDNTIYEQYWPLDTIYPNEEIIIEYSVVYDEHTLPGSYINHAQIEAIAGDPSLEPIIGTFISSSIATSTVNIATSTTVDIITEEESETKDSPITLELNEEEFPVIIRKTTGIGYILSLIKGDMFTPVPMFLGEEQKEEEQLVASAFHVLDKLGGFTFVGSSAAQFFSTESSGGNKGDASGSKSTPYGQFASILDSLVKTCALPYSWFFILVLLGFTLTLLMRTRTNIVY